MKSDKLFDAIGEISDDLITSSLAVKKRKNKPKIAVLIAACLCVAVLSVTVGMMLQGAKDNEKGYMHNVEKNDDVMMNSPVHDGNMTNSQAPATSSEPTPPEANDSYTGDGNNNENHNPPDATNPTPDTAKFYGDELILGSRIYSEWISSDNHIYTKDKLIADIMWNGELWQIYSINEFPDRSAVMLVTDTGETKMFTTKIS